MARGEPDLYVEPGWGAPGSRISVRGVGFPRVDGEVELYLESMWLDTIDVDSEGDFAVILVVPAIESGWYLLRAVQFGGEVEVSIPFKVGVILVLLSETSGLVGSEIILTGVGFSPGGFWSAYLGEFRIFGETPVNRDETISGVFVVPKLIPGEHVITVVDHETGIEVEVDFTITGAPWIEVDPSEVFPGQAFVVRGFDFARMKDVRIELYIDEPRFELGTIWTNIEGEFQASLSAPDLTEGRYTLVAEDPRRSIFATAPLDILAPAAEELAISMSASSASILTLDEATIWIEVTLDGAPLPWAYVALEWDALMGDLEPAELETGEDGRAETVFTSKTRLGEATITGIASYKEMEAEDRVVIRIDNRPPVARILSIEPSPATGEDSVSFTGQASDRDNEITSYSWFSDIDDFLGSGMEITSDDLTEGLHRITFLVQDIAGDIDEDSWFLSVEAPDTSGPTIGSIDHTPSRPSMDQEVEVTCTVEDESSVESVTLLCGVGDEMESIPMRLVGGTWTARIREHGPGATVNFMIEAVDGAENANYSEIESYSVERIFWVIPPTIPEVVVTGVAAVAVYALSEYVPTPDPAEPRERSHKRDDQEFSWLVITPRSIQPGGKSMAFVVIRNPGTSPVDGLVVDINGPPDVLIAPRALKSWLNVGRFYNRFILISVGREARGSKVVTFSLSKGGQPVETIVRKIGIKELKVGLLRDKGNSDYLVKIGQQPLAPDPVEEWLKEKGFDYEKITEAGEFGALRRYNVIVAPSQLALRDAAVDNIRKYVRKGGGLVALDAFGSIDYGAFEEDRPSPGGEKRVAELLGYAEPESAPIYEGYKGLRIQDSGHRVTRGYLEESDVSLVVQEGVAFTSGTAKSRMLASQRVRLEEEGGYMDVAGLVVRGHWKGRVVHFNFRVEEIVRVVSHLLDKSVNWAARFE